MSRRSSTRSYAQKRRRYLDRLSWSFPEPPSACGISPRVAGGEWIRGVLRAGSGAAGSVIPAPLRHSCAGRNPGDRWGSRALPTFDGTRSGAVPPGGSGGPSGGWRLVARLGGRMDSCLRRNDGGGAGMTDRAPTMFDGARSRGVRRGLWRAVGWIKARRAVGRSHGFLRRNDGGGAGMTEGAPPVAAELILNTVGLSLISPRRAGEPPSVTP